MKNVLIALILTFSLHTFGQSNINDFKYVIVPHQFDFLNEPDKYMLNSLLKQYLEKKGFEVYFNDENFPADLAVNNCLALKAQVTNKSNLFSSKTNVNLINCNNQAVFMSEEGSSNSKDFRQSYQESLRNALQSLDAADYKYNYNAAITKNVLPGAQNVVQQQNYQQQIVVQTPAANAVIPVIETSIVDMVADGDSYMLKPNDKGFELYKKSVIDDVVNYGMIATLKPTGQPGIFLTTYKKQTTIGYFDAQGNLTIELTDANGKSETKVFKKQ
ncbi:MAG: hypothetical protein U1C58_08665 [Flavobacteriaceae bacterium]|nr:hypothetical protein [Flavobacteriaceae bacterium]MDZ4148341.1 hypothetical protein [Flavobacteriaceae bacterium]